jgi:hypothetical protein
MNYNTKLTQYVPKGTATRAVVGGFKPNVFANKTKGFFEKKLNPFSGTAFFGPSKPGYVNSSGIARTSNYRDRQIIINAARKKANNNAKKWKTNGYFGPETKMSNAAERNQNADAKRANNNSARKKANNNAAS